MADVRVKITTEADTSPLAQYKAQMDVLEKNLGTAGKQTENLQVKKADLKKTIQELGREIPLLGRATLFLVSPLAVVAGSIGAVILALKNWLAQIDEAERKLEIHERLSRGARAMGTAAAQAAGELLQFNIELGQMAERAEGAVKRLDAVLNALRKVENHQAEKRDAQEGLEMAQIDAAERTGKITEVDAINRRAAVKAKFRGQREAAAAGQLQEEQEARQDLLRREMEGRVGAESALPGALEAAAAAERAAKTAPDKAKSDLAAIATEREELEKELKRQRALQQGSTGNFWKDLALPMLGKEAGQQLAREQREAPGRIDALERRRDQLDRQEFTVKERQEAAEADAKAKRKSADDLKKRIETGRTSEGKLFGDIIQGDQDIEQSRFHRRQVGALTRAADDINRDTAVWMATAKAEKARADAAERVLNEIFRGMGIHTNRLDAMEKQLRANHGR